MRVKVDDRRFRLKMRRLEAALKEFGDKFTVDAATYLQAKIVGDVLDGPGGAVYPKTGYPGGISDGASGFVGQVSGNLKSSIQTERENRYTSRVGVDPGAAPVGDYAEAVRKWSEEKYGRDFVGIALDLYGEAVEQAAREELKRLSTAISKGGKYQYQNPFPA